jgi:hypothetical protein
MIDIRSISIMSAIYGLFLLNLDDRAMPGRPIVARQRSSTHRRDVVEREAYRALSERTG